MGQNRVILFCRDQLYVVLADIRCAGYSASVLIEGAENWLIFDLLNVSIPSVNISAKISSATYTLSWLNE